MRSELAQLFPFPPVFPPPQLLREICANVILARAGVTKYTPPDFRNINLVEKLSLLTRYMLPIFCVGVGAKVNAGNAVAELGNSLRWHWRQDSKSCEVVESAPISSFKSPLIEAGCQRILKIKGFSSLRRGMEKWPEFRQSGKTKILAWERDSWTLASCRPISRLFSTFLPLLSQQPIRGIASCDKTSSRCSSFRNICKKIIASI